MVLGRFLADRIFPAEVHHGMTWQEIHEVCRHANGPHARAAAAVRDAEGFMKI